jgi:hypothetical protein
MLVHHHKLRVNAELPDEADLDVYRESGWAKGLHKDTDPDDPSPIPRVLPLPEPEPEPEPPAKAKAKATEKES